jgi:hypothetical protein
VQCRQEEEQEEEDPILLPSSFRFWLHSLPPPLLNSGMVAAATATPAAETPPLSFCAAKWRLSAKDRMYLEFSSSWLQNYDSRRCDNVRSNLT